MKYYVYIESSHETDNLFIGTSSEKDCDIVVDDNVMAILQKNIDSEEGLTMSEIEGLIDNGCSELLDLDNQLNIRCQNYEVKHFIKGIEKDKCSLDVSWAMNRDLASGQFTPKKSFEEYLKCNGINTKDKNYDEDDANCEYEEWLQNEEYIPWLNTLTIDEQADKLGLDSWEICMENRFFYVIGDEEDIHGWYES